MKRGVWFLTAVALIWISANLPAGLIRFFIDEQNLAVIAPRGTLWNGSATVVSNLGLRAHCHWQTSILRPGLDLHITDDITDVLATIQLNLSGATMTLSGSIGTSTLQPLLERYDLFLTGGFDLGDSHWALQQETIRLLKTATVQWNGGPVRYILANKLYTANMPALDAQISNGHTGQWQASIVLGEGSFGGSEQAHLEQPLLLLRLSQGGAVYIGVSRGLLRLANFPWQGDEADSDLIFEVERSL